MSEPRADIVRQAFEMIGGRVRVDVDVEMVIVGGGAALLIGLVPPAQATADIDAIQFVPAGESDEILRVAGEVGRELSLDPDWLNEHSRQYFHALPDDWRTRSQTVGRFGRLTVIAIGRTDFIAMKFYAHRPGDLEHSEALDLARTNWISLDVTSDELASRQVGELSRIEMARFVLKDWRVTHGCRT